MKRSKAKAAPQQVPTPGSQGGKAAVSESQSTPGSGRRVAAPTHEEIETVAYLKYLAEGSQDGGHLRHWLEAERQLRE